MARIQKTSLSYFPFDVDFFNDDKIKLMSARFGSKGEIIAVKLLCKIYGTNGYYYPWGEDESLLFAQSVGDGITHSLVNDVVNELAKRGFFNKAIFDTFKILTSTGIQERYLNISKQLKRTVEINEKWDCTKLKMIRNALIPEKEPIIPEKQESFQEKSSYKEKERKEKEMKVKEMKGKTTENSIWIEQACMNLRTDTQTLLRFCENWISKAVIEMKFESYPVNSLISFMVKDFAPEKLSSSGEKQSKLSQAIESHKGAEGLLGI